MGLFQDRTAASDWYDAVSSIYDPLVGETFWPRHLQRRLLEHFSVDASDRVLDVGCGTGVTCDLLADRAGRVDALDLSASQLRRADCNGKAAFVRGDAHQLPYASDIFDAVVSIGAILYFPDPVAALAEAHRVTRPGGRLLVGGFNRPPFPSVNPAENVASIANETFFHTWNADDVRASLAAAGWQHGHSEVTGPLWHPRLARVATAQKRNRRGA
jgi:demethylmenaquinone methyltransferase/2-methoxy-6-polyprenyl-1,4-benzoquinol methylase